MPKKLLDSEMIGLVSGRLTVLERVGNSDNWECLCSCGNQKTVVKDGRRLRKNEVRSCGCLQKENARKQAENNTGVAKKHGQTYTKEYVAWRNMKARCDDVNQQAYHNYGARGITYDVRWKDFENFYEDMGDCPEGMSLDRLDVMGDYSKDNCSWVPISVQHLHRRKPKSGKSSPYKGVSFSKDCGKYKGTLKYLGNYYHLGYSESAEYLAKKYDELMIELSGDDKGTNKALGLLP
jgi:hypothetical protein